ncbi:uncharacterized protein V1516DRAFT_681000 [Lipomyces oligophaga]|uniref:uncharacterized protein n=1 Tax=Lipomyces oligophaga TaxID=45792 RepID=UPI0034CE8056
MAKKKATQQKISKKSIPTENDFIGTISDSDSEVPDLDDNDIDSELDNEDESKESAGDEKVRRKQKASSRNADSDFKLDFDVGDFGTVSAFDGWDFDLQDSAAKGSDRRQVDLDGIIQRQLRKNNSNSDDDEDDSDEEENEKEVESEEGEVGDSDDEADESLIPRNVTLDEEANDSDEEAKSKSEKSKKSKAFSESKAEKELKKSRSVTKNERVEQEELLSSDDSEEDDSDHLDGPPGFDDSSSDNDTAEEQDSDQAIAAFFETAPKDKTNSDGIQKQFHMLNVSRPLLRSIAALGFVSPTPIQSAVIPVAMTGKDVVAGAVTGSGKTAAYMIPVLERLLFRPKKVASTRVVVLTPTRELAIQVSDVGRKLSQFVPGLRFGLAVGGLNLRAQEQELKARPDIVVATPGRFIDHVRNSPSFQVDDVEILVIDEADRMLEEGFQKELTELLTLMPTRRQTLLFSATMNSSIKSLIQLSLHRPVRIMINPPKQAASGLIQEFIRIRKRETFKPAILYWLLSKFDRHERTMVFVSRKETAHRLRVILGLLGMKVGELHGALSQEQRLTGITEFRNSTVPVLICTDLASRGLDIPRVEVVVNYDMPKTHEIYLHRVGRTARAGRTGRSISLVGEVKAERVIVREAVKSIEKGKGRAVSRNLDWNAVSEFAEKIDNLENTVDQVLKEEKEEKQIAIAEMQLKKSENLIKHMDEIKSRPKRTWFEDDSSKRSKPNLGQKRTKKEQNERPQVKEGIKRKRRAQ